MIEHGRIECTTGPQAVWRFQCSLCDAYVGVRVDLADNVHREVLHLACLHLRDVHDVYEPAIEHARIDVAPRKYFIIELP